MTGVVIPDLQVICGRELRRGNTDSLTVQRLLLYNKLCIYMYIVGIRMRSLIQTA